MDSMNIKEKRREDRRGEDRRSGDRRVADRRVGDRRAGEPYGKWKPKRKIRREMKVLLGLLGATLILLILNLAYFNPPPKRKMVEVEIKDIGVWRCPPSTLSEYFATQDALKGVAEGKKVISSKVLNEMTQIRSEGLKKSAGTKNDYLLERVRGMPWEEFASRAEFTPKRRGVEKPSPQQCSAAIKSARMTQ
jgi:hypothetical protein